MTVSRTRQAYLGVLAVAAATASATAPAATLPIPCSAGNCGAFVAPGGAATGTQSGSKLTINQTSQNATLNWQSFNISKDGSVQFVQPGQDAVALNRIFDPNPSQIFGALNANGRIYLINQNGILFGPGAQVNVGSLLATTLNTNIDTAFGYSLLAPNQLAPAQPVFQRFVDANGNPLPSGTVTIAQGASLSTPEGGQILVFAPQITNQGSISTPGGQTVLAAGTTVYLAAQNDANLRGLLVEVSADSAANSSVTNGDQAANAGAASPDQLIGQIVAARGNITLAGLAVNQLGRVSATTSINENGSIRLQAYQGTLQTLGGDLPGAGGTLTLGAHSLTDVTLETSDTATTVDSVVQPKSNVALFGATIDVLGGSTVRATSGTITATALANLSSAPPPGSEDGSRIYIAPDATLDVSGASVTLPVSSNVIAVQLRGTELADSPLQQNGPLRCTPTHCDTVYIDIRAHGTNANGTTWQGTPFANVSGEIGAIQRNVAERNLTGGTLSLQSGGDVIVAPGAQLNVSGGEIQYTGGVVSTTTLLTTNGQSVPIAAADPNVLYLGTLNQFQLGNTKWNTSTTYTGLAGTYQPGYVQGEDAGTLSVSAPRFVLDGSIAAQVIAGTYQRLPSSQPQNGGGFLGYDNLPQLYRNYDEQPLGALLTIGGVGAGGSAGQPNLVVDGVIVQPGTVLSGLRASDGSAFDPLSGEPLPVSYASSLLSPAFAEAFAHVSVSANGEIELPQGTALKFPAGGSLALQASAIDIEGSVDIPGGSITAGALPTIVPASAVVLTLGPEAALTARGEWVNDNPLLYGGQDNTAPLFTSGGRISLTSQANVGASSMLELDAGSVLDVSGGAQLTKAGALVPGGGGTITLAALPQGNWNPAEPVFPAHIDLGAVLRGYGLTKGGTLNISAGSVCIAASDCSGGDANTFWLSPSQFSGGFGAYNITASQGGLDVVPGTLLTLQQLNTQLVPGFSMLANAAVLPALSAPARLPDITRNPVSLTLTQHVLPDAEDALGNPILVLGQTTPSLVVGQGAVIAADPGAQLALSSNDRILIEGELDAPAGTISATVAQFGNAIQGAYEPTQGIWLGPQGVLAARGFPQIFVGDTGQPSGNVLSGGQVTLSALHGFVVLDPGSLIDVSGSSATIAISQPFMPVRTQQVGSAGGAITLGAAEGMLVDGTLEGAAGASGPAAAQPPGGSLSIALNGQSLYTVPGSGTPASFANQLIVTPTLAPIVVAPGSAVPSSFAGEALVGADTLNGSGLSAVTLQVKPFVANTALQGEILFSDNVSLDAPLEVTLDAASVGVSPGGLASVQAPYVEFGNSSTLGNQPPAPPLNPSGTGTLVVQGQVIELYGSTSLLGVGDASFESASDLRLRGVQNTFDIPPTPTISGGLFAAGDITLTASQVYPTTLSQFVISTGGTITVKGTPDAIQDLLSAGGSLTLRANSVIQSGVLRAPFGTLDIEANSIELSAGSVTSTSANGLTVPFGTTQGEPATATQVGWVYPTPNGASAVYGTSGAALTPPAQRIVLNGATVSLDRGAVVDVSGGGDLQAYEWIPGVGGTQDVLSAATRPNQFAIVPGLHLNVAPFDTSLSAGTNLQVGDAVYLAGAPGVPAGVYQLLPARYALLPGAFLVSQVAGYQDIQPGVSYPVLSGGEIVAGYRTFAGTSYGDSRTSGFEVVPASVVLAQAQYVTTSANQFFSEQAAAANVPAPRLPQDSGALELLASSSLALNGTLRTQAGTGGLGATVDIASSQILVAADSSVQAAPGQLLLIASSLDQLGAQSVLLGGQRGTNGAITTDATTVTIGAGAALSGPEIDLTASDQVTVGAGASITASGSDPTERSYTLQGDGAFLSVSAGPQASVVRSGQSGGAGVLTLASGSSLNATQGSIYLDGSANVISAGSIVATGGDLAVQSTRIGIGAPAQPVAGTVLAPSLFAGALHNVLLSSSSTVDFYGSVALSAQNLAIDAQGIAGYGGATDTAAAVVTNVLQLSGAPSGTSSQAPVAGTGSGTLSFGAGDIELGAGIVSFTGFTSTTLAAQRAITATASGGLTVAGDLTASASQITTGFATGTGSQASAAETPAASISSSLSASGAVRLLAPAQIAALPAVTNLGGSLSISGATVELGTAIVLPSGAVTLTAAGGDLTLDAGGLISVAGLVRQYDQVSVATPAGSVALWASGNLTAAAGSTVDVSAAAGGNGGTLSVSAAAGAATLSGVLKGTGSGAQGASFAVDAQQFDFAALNQALNGGGFTGGRSFRLRGAGDLVVGAGADDAVTAQSVSLEADQGSIVVDGLIDASGASGGSVLLAASGDVNLSGSVDAHATAAGGRGGHVSLETTAGNLLLQSGSLINVSGGGPDASGDPGAGGQVLLRVPAATVEAVGTGGSGVVLAGQIQGATKTTLEAFNTYDYGTLGGLSSTVITPSAASVIFNDATTLMAQAPAITTALNAAASWNFALEPGIEIDSTGALELDTPWNLYTWRFGSNSVPGLLTLRAAGGVTINASLSDGFATPTTFSLPTAPSSSWSYRIVAGADLSAADPLAVSAFAPGAVAAGSAAAAELNIAGCKASCTLSSGGRGGGAYLPTLVRTGDGFIQLASSGDFLLGSLDGSGNFTPGSTAALVYTAGVAGPGLAVTGGRGTVTLQGRAYPINGGDISISVGGDVLGAANDTQFVNAWLWRVPPATGNSAHPPAWTVDFQSFQQGIAALGGGDVTVTAAGDVRNLSVSIPSIGVPMGATLATSTLEVTGGGSLVVNSGGSVLGGSYYVGLGNLAVRAGGNVGAQALADGGTGLAPLIGLGQASVTVAARGDLELSDILTPTLLNTGPYQSVAPVNDYYSGYGPGSSATLIAVGGTVTLNDHNADLSSAFGSSFAGQVLFPSSSDTNWAGEPAVLDALPPTLNVFALNGSIDIGRAIVLTPSASGNLQLFANQNISLTAVGGSQLIVPDADPTLVPSATAPVVTPNLLTLYTDVLSAPYGKPANDVYGATPAHLNDPTPVHVVAASGDVVFSGGAVPSVLWSAKAVDVVAGEDIIDLNLIAQNLQASDVTSISAGRDISYPAGRDVLGNVLPNTAQITIGGPGFVQLAAGRDVNLGTAQGLVTEANLANPSLAPTGASISVQAGIAAQAPQLAAFIAKYIDSSTQFDPELVAFVENATAAAGLTAAQAKQQFDAMSAGLQRAFVEQVFLELLRIYGEKEANTSSGDYSGAFAALTTLFPGSNPDTATHEPNTYAGNIELFFSRIYSLQGGDISLFAPGGEVNVGLAEAPTSFGVSKAPDQLGVVAQTSGSVSAVAYNNFDVNQSRVIAADGGNILVWSTEGNIDAGRGSKTALSAPPATATINAQNGRPIITLRAPLTGSGIQSLSSTPGIPPGNVDLFAPHGVVIANDAGIVAGNLTVAATAVIGANNITVSGTSVGVPVAVTGIGAGVAGASSSAAGAANSGATSLAESRAEQSKTPAADTALSWLDVFVLGFGEETCKAEDVDCLKRQQKN